MKRQEIIKKLIKEGFSPKTLVNFSDKQLITLSERVLSEDADPVVNIPKTDTEAITKAKQNKKVFTTYENEMRESDDDEDDGQHEVTWDDLAKALHIVLSQGNYGFSLNEDIDASEDKQIVMKRLLFKIQHAKDDTKLNDWLEIIKTINDGKIPQEILDVLDGVESDDEEVNAEDWVDKLVQEKFVSTKNDILESIKKKIKEQETVIKKKPTSIPKFFSYDSIKSVMNNVEPAVKPKTPKTKPNEKPRPKHPLQPGKTPNPKPKAGLIPENKKKKEVKNVVNKKTYK